MSCLLIYGCAAQSDIGFVRVKKYQDIIIHHKPKQVTYFTYKPAEDENGNIVKGEIINKGLPGHVISNGVVLKFNEKGEHVEMDVYGVGDTIYYGVSKYQYLKKNTVKSIGSMNGISEPEEFEIDYMIIEKYDDLGNLAYEGEYCPPCFDKKYKVKPSSEVFYTYDDKGGLVEKKKYTYRYGYNYDQPGKILDSSITNFTPEYKYGKLYKNAGSIYIYNEDGSHKEILEETGAIYEYYPNNICKKIYFTETDYAEFNSDGYLVLRRFPKNRYMIYEYDNLDMYGNWTRVIIKDKGKPVVYGERKITYYE